MTALLIITALILLNGLFVAAEFAIVGAPKAAIERRAASGHRLARAVLGVLRDTRQQDRYIATAQLGITLASLGLGMYGEHVLAEALYRLLGGTGGPAWLASHTFASVLAVSVLTYFHIVLGEMVPKSLALQRAETIVLWITPAMLWTKTLLFPLVAGLNGLGTLIMRAMGIRRQAQHAEQYYTPEELQLIVQESEMRGALRRDASRMLQELFEFGDLTAEQVMVPRVRIIGIEVGTSPAEIREMLGTAPHTRYPVYEKDLDHIIGMIHIKDLLGLLLRDETIAASHARPLPLMPVTAELDDVLETMRREETQMVIVLDEHGGTAGIVTLEDLFEEVVGEIGESPTDTPPFYRDAQGRLRVPGTMRVDEVGQQFNLDVEHEEVDSVSGLVLTLLGRVPRVGDSVRYERLLFEVTAVKGHGVEECAVLLEDAR
ncbi:MAG TPA: hemolysin family protein [Vicinamibacterales bacterium]|nr:hemolysin family protein [Vicinamibacterales bacterium]HWI20716.1 hemolysin family protein [Vicinamibacterales bacterium]